MLFAFLTLILSQEYSGVIQRLPECGAAPDYRIIQLSSIKPNIKEIYTNVKQCHSSNYFVLEKLISH